MFDSGGIGNEKLFFKYRVEQKAFYLITRLSHRILGTFTVAAGMPVVGAHYTSACQNALQSAMNWKHKN